VLVDASEGTAAEELTSVAEGVPVSTGPVGSLLKESSIYNFKLQGRKETHLTGSEEEGASDVAVGGVEELFECKSQRCFG
jgi:hypothetical protein